MAQFQFKSQENPSLRQRVATDIRNAIIRGALKPGDKLRELDIAEQMGISRGPIREAIRDLEAMGLVVVSPYRETVVADVDKDEIVDLLIPIRLQLELFSIRSHLDDYDAHFFESLEQCVANMRKMAAKEDLFGLIEGDIRFHEQIIAYNNSTYTMQIWAGIVNRLRLHFIKNTKEFVDLAKVPMDHEALIDALKKKDMAQITAMWTQHVRNDDCLLCFV